MNAELFYFFIDFSELILDKVNLADKMSDLNFFGNRGNADGVFSSVLEGFGGKSNTTSSARYFKAFAKGPDVSSGDFVGAGKFPEDFHVNSAVFGFEKAVVFGKDDVDAFLKSVGVNIQFLFQIMMMSGELPLLIKVKGIYP